MATEKRKHSPGLTLRAGVWHIDKQVRGVRICESTGTGNLREAEEYLAQRVAETIALSAKRPADRTFIEAATRYLNEEHHKSLDRDAQSLKNIVPWLASVPLHLIHSGMLKPYLDSRLNAGVSPATVNREIAVIRRILNLSARAWRDDGTGLPWLLQAPPLLRFVPHPNPRQPRTITRAEEACLRAALQEPKRRLVQFTLYTGMRDSEARCLTWPEIGPAGVTLAGTRTKNGHPRTIPLCRTARAAIEGLERTGGYVFTYRGQRFCRIRGGSWAAATRRAGLSGLRVHDLRHTFASRLRALGVSVEDRADLLGHYRGSITTHYSHAELARLQACVDLLDLSGDC